LGTAQNNADNTNIATQLAAGQDQRSIQAQQASAMLQYLSTIQGLDGVNPASLFGQSATANGTSTSASTSTQTSNPSLFDDLSSIFSLGSPTSAAGQGASNIYSVAKGFAPGG
jgi:hypothetical protein